MTVRTLYGEYANCVLTTAKYQMGGGLHIEIWNEEDGPIAVLTRNLVGERKPKENEAYVDLNNCPCALDFIEEYELGKTTDYYGHSGFCIYPLVAFDMDKIKEYEDGSGD